MAAPLNEYALRRQRADEMRPRALPLVALASVVTHGRAGTHIEIRNAPSSRSMETDLPSQSRNRQLVEGLLTVAISYCLFGLLSCPAKGPEELLPHFPAHIFPGFTAPVAVICVYLLMHRQRGHIISTE